MDAPFKTDFPNLVDVAAKKTSEIDQRYNCIAWAFGDNTRWWWPNKRSFFWPTDSKGLSTMEAFLDCFSKEGWKECDNEDFDTNFEKIALYCLNGEPKHAARMLAQDTWTSKLGQNIDLRHTLHELAGPTYGTVAHIFCRKRPK